MIGKLHIRETRREVFTISRGDVRRGAELALELMAIAERYGEAPALRWFRNVRLTPPYWRGDWDQAIRVADEFIATGPVEEE